MVRTQLQSSRIRRRNKMELNSTPKGNRLHIGIFGRRNAGKSSLINALTGQNLAIVSDTPGTTADPVFKAMELHPIGPVVFIDTAGFDDEGDLGQLRVAKTEEIINRTDVAILVLDSSAPDFTCEEQWLDRLASANVPVIPVLNKVDTLSCPAEKDCPADFARGLSSIAVDHASALDSVICVSAKTGEGIDQLRTAIQNAVPDDFMQARMLGELLDDGSLVLLVMPQDIQAPKGRLILPQVQTIRELLDRKCSVMSTTADGYEKALAALNRAPDLIITDSQCFSEVYQKKPEQSALTSFSIIMAASKGDIDVFLDGVSAIDRALQAMGLGNSLDVSTAMNSASLPCAADSSAKFRVLIAEACTHVPLNEDIGSVKIPRLLHKLFGDRVSITSVRGNDFPDADGLKEFDLIIHCGACMFNRRHVMSRIAVAREAGVPITNYGIFLARAAGILDKVSLPR